MFDDLYIKLKSGHITDLSQQPRYVISKAYKIYTTKTKSGKSKIGEMIYSPDFRFIDRKSTIWEYVSIQEFQRLGTTTKI